MRFLSSLYRIIIVGIFIFSSGCSRGTTPPIDFPNSLPLPQVFTTLLPHDATPSPTFDMVEPLKPSEPNGVPKMEYGKIGEAEFGVEIHSFDVDFAEIQALGAKWIRYNGVKWSDIEPTEGEFDWEKLGAFDEGLKKSREAGLKMIVTVRSAPYWAQKYGGYYCGQIKEEKFTAFGIFMTLLAVRYSQDPYYVYSWEIWNEPDVDPSLVAGTSPFGCWGDQSDAFYGGGYYAEMMKVVVPLMRTATPDVKVFLGGLLLDCDPTYPGLPGNCAVGSELPPRFFEGVLRNGGGSMINFVGFHGGFAYNPSFYSPVYLELGIPTWQTRGGVIAGKANYLREVMSAYQSNLPLFLTETNILCPENYTGCNPVSSDFLQKQAEYGAWQVVRNYAEDISTIWYTFEGPGWRNGGLLDKDQNPRPVYYSIQNALRRITGSFIVRKIDEFSGLSGYEFQSQQTKFYFLAPITENPPQWVVPDNAVEATDIFGQPIPLESLSPLVSPVFIDIQ